MRIKNWNTANTPTFPDNSRVSDFHISYVRVQTNVEHSHLWMATKDGANMHIKICVKLDGCDLFLYKASIQIQDKTRRESFLT
jgi:hypothetical protein